MRFTRLKYVPLYVFAFCLVPLILLYPGCSTDVVPKAPEPRSRAFSVRGSVETGRMMEVYSTDFQQVYGEESPWKTYMLVYLSVRFLAKEGLSQFRALNRKEQDTYPGIQTFNENVEKHGGPWNYAAQLALKTFKTPGARKEFRTELNFEPFQNFAVGKWLKTRLESEEPLPDFGIVNVEPEFYRPILRSVALILTAQYYLQSYQRVSEPTVLDDHYNTDMSWILDQWRQNYLRIRSIWKPRFDLPELSTHTLSPLYEPAEERPMQSFWQVNPTERRFGRSTLPFREIYDVTVENIPPRMRDLQTKAIQEYIEERLHSSLRRWLETLTYGIKFRLLEELSQHSYENRSDVDFYARNALEDINNILDIN